MNHLWFYCAMALGALVAGCGVLEGDFKTLNEGDPVVSGGEFDQEATREAIAEFNQWLAAHPYNRAAHKIDLKKICGLDFGEACEFIDDDSIMTGGASCDIPVPFPPFKRMHRLFGPQPGHPMSWCHFGLSCPVPPSDLVVAGDYENEARLLKRKLESMFGIEMSEQKILGGRGYEYSDEYNRISIVLDMKTGQGEEVCTYPLVVDVWDLELMRQYDQLRKFYRKAQERARGVDAREGSVR